MSREGLKKQGYLYKLPVKGLVKKWTKRWFMLYGTTHGGVVRLEYYDNPETMMTGSSKRTIPLRECTEVSSTIGSKVHPYAFQFTSQLGHHVFASETLLEVDSWIDDVKAAIHEDKIKRRRSKAQSRVATSSGSDISESGEKGISYKNKVDSGTYRVTLEENETSQRMNLSGAYNLELGPSKISLAATSGTTIFSLSYKFLKNYGKQSGQFHFETGKNSPIGEGKLVMVTTCSKEIFGVVHSNIKRLKEQGQRKLSSEGQTSAKSSQGVVKLRTKMPPPPKSVASGRTSIGGRSSSRNSAELGSESTQGKFRSSKNMEEEMASNSAAKQSDVAALYAVVDKTKKTPKKDDAAQSSGPQDKKMNPVSELKRRDQLAPSHNVRDSRLSTMLVELDDNAFDDSFDEDEEENDNCEYNDNLEPLAEGVTNPFDDDDGDFGQDTNQDIPASFTEQVGGNDVGSVNDNTGSPEAKSDNILDIEPPREAATSDKDINSTPLTSQPPQYPVAPINSTLISISEPPPQNPVAPVNSTLSSISEPPPEEKKVDKVLGDLDFGFGPGNLEPVVDKGNNAPSKNDSNSNSEAPQAKSMDVFRDLDFAVGNPQESATSNKASTLQDLNFDFGDLPPLQGLGSDPFSSPLSNPPPLTGNFADLDFATLDNNFFDNLEAMDIKGQPPPTAAGLGTAFNFDNWDDTNTTL